MYFRLKPLKISLFTAALFVIMSLVRGQSVPSLVNYQGRLTDVTGQALPTGTYGVAFRIWSKKAATEVGDQLIWGQEYNVTIQGGQFYALLGSPGQALPGASVNDLASAFTDPERYVGLTITRGTNGAPINAPSEIIPRQRILSTPYSLVAQRATTLDAISANVLSPIGAIISFGGTEAPNGWLVCDGRIVDSAAYPELFQVLGEKYGDGGDGPGGKFNLPDLRSRFPLGVGQGTPRTSRVIGTPGGEETHVLTVEEMPAHGHVTRYSTDGGGNTTGRYVAGSTFAAGAARGLRRDDYNSSAPPDNLTGGGLPHNVMPPFMVVNFIIKY